MGQASQPSRTTGHVVYVEAQPAPISLELGRAAVLVIDMQNDFGAQGGMFDFAGIDISMIQTVFSLAVCAPVDYHVCIKPDSLGRRG